MAILSGVGRRALGIITSPRATFEAVAGASEGNEQDAAKRVRGVRGRTQEAWRMDRR